MEQTTIFKPVEVTKVEDIKITAYRGVEVIKDGAYEEKHTNQFSTLRCKVDMLSSKTTGRFDYRVRLQENGIAIMYSQDLVWDEYDRERYCYITVFYRIGNTVTQWTFYEEEYKQIAENFCLPRWDALIQMIYMEKRFKNSWKKTLFELLKSCLEFYRVQPHLTNMKQ